MGVNSLLLDEREHRILADIEHLEHEDRIADLEEKRKKLLLRQKRREIEPYEDRLDEPMAARKERHSDAQFSAHRELSTDGHSLYGLGCSCSHSKSSWERRCS